MSFNDVLKAARQTGGYVNGEVADISAADAVPTLGTATRALVVGVAGIVKVDFGGGALGVVLTLPAGIHPLVITKLYKTGTTATTLAFLY